MELNDWLAIIGAFGGLEAVRWGVTFWVNRKTNARKEDASADSMEDENERKQVDWLEERIAQRDAKIDALYVELQRAISAMVLSMASNFSGGILPRRTSPNFIEVHI